MAVQLVAQAPSVTKCLCHGWVLTGIITFRLPSSFSIGCARFVCHNAQKWQNFEYVGTFVLREQSSGVNKHLVHARSCSCTVDLCCNTYWLV